MYVSVDMDKMRFLHKHEDFVVVSDLAWIEAPTGALEITPVDNPHFLRHATELELHLLYKNTTGEESVPRYGQELRSVIFGLMEKIPVSDIVKHEVHAQAEFLEGEHEGYHYVKGSRKPSQLTTLFMEPLKVKMTTEEISAAAIVKRVIQKVFVAEDRPVVAAPRQSASNKQIIWNMMNEVWTANGCPKDTVEILRMRRAVMVRLETEYGIKKTSSSSELGNWQKSIN